MKPEISFDQPPGIHVPHAKKFIHSNPLHCAEKTAKRGAATYDPTCSDAILVSVSVLLGQKIS